MHDEDIAFTLAMHYPRNKTKHIPSTLSLNLIRP
jgi:hypothetical protein